MENSILKTVIEDCIPIQNGIDLEYIFMAVALNLAKAANKNHDLLERMCPSVASMFLDRTHELAKDTTQAELFGKLREAIRGRTYEVLFSSIRPALSDCEKPISTIQDNAKIERYQAVLLLALMCRCRRIENYKTPFKKYEELAQEAAQFCKIEPQTIQQIYNMIFPFEKTVSSVERFLNDLGAKTKLDYLAFYVLVQTTKAAKQDSETWRIPSATLTAKPSAVSWIFSLLQPHLKLNANWVSRYNNELSFTSEAKNPIWDLSLENFLGCFMQGCCHSPSAVVQYLVAEKNTPVHFAALQLFFLLKAAEESSTPTGLCEKYNHMTAKHPSLHLQEEDIRCVAYLCEHVTPMSYKVAASRSDDAITYFKQNNIIEEDERLRVYRNAFYDKVPSPKEVVAKSYKAERAERYKKLHSIPPWEMVRRIYSRDGDASVDNSIVSSAVVKALSSVRQPYVLLFNPSFAFLEQWTNHLLTKHLRTIVYLPFKEPIALLNEECNLPHLLFTSKLDSLCDFDFIVSFWRNESTWKTHFPVETVKDTAELLAVLPQKVLQKEPYHDFREQLFHNLRPTYLTLLPSELLREPPQKKVLVHLVKGSADSEGILPVNKHKRIEGIFPKGSPFFPCSRKHAFLKVGALSNGSGINLKSFVGADGKPINAIPAKYRPKQELRICDDVCIFFSTDGNSLCRYYFHSFPRIGENGKPSKGKALPAHHLRIKSPEAVAQTILKKIFANKAFIDAARKEICDAFLRTKQLLNLSLFAFWFFFHDDVNLQGMLENAIGQKARKRKGKQGIVETNMLVKENYWKMLHETPLGKLSLKEGKEAYITAIKETSPQKYVYYLKLTVNLLNAAVQRKFIKFNPLAETLQEHNRKIKLLQSVKRALQGKTLSIEQERLLLQYIEELLDAEDEDGRAIGLALRLLAGLRTVEVCALKIGDIKRKNDPTIHYILVSKRVGEVKGNGVPSVTLYTEVRRFRRVPISGTLYRLLKKRLAYLKKIGCGDDDYLVTNATQNTPCLPKMLNDFTRDALKNVAQLKENIFVLHGEDGEDYEDDYAKYQGDFFVSNFKNRVQATCGFCEGEMRAVLGLKPKEVLFSHYVDFSNPTTLEHLRLKMLAWDDALSPQTSAATSASGVFVDELSISGSQSSGLLHTRATFRIDRPFTDGLKLKISSGCGFDGSATFKEGKK